jgi:hypothetical protein
MAEAIVSYDLTDFGNDRYRYDYEVTNVSLPDAIEEFTVWFDYSLFANLALATPDPPAGDWDELVVQPAPGLPDDGYYDALGVSGGIAMGSGVAGFAVEFDWLGEGLPGSQPFDIVDPETFDIVFSDFTVPEPGTWGLLLVGMLGSRRRFVNRAA